MEPTPPVRPEFHTVDEAARILKVSPQTLRRRMAIIPHKKIGNQYRIPDWWVRLTVGTHTRLTD